MLPCFTHVPCLGCVCNENAAQLVFHFNMPPALQRGEHFAQMVANSFVAAHGINTGAASLLPHTMTSCNSRLFRQALLPLQLALCKHFVSLPNLCFLLSLQELVYTQILNQELTWL
jgi:hypothetical protein